MKKMLEAVFTVITSLLLMTPSVVLSQSTTPEPSYFTSTYKVLATPDQIIAPNGTSIAGQCGAYAVFELMINVDLNVLCYNVTTYNLALPYLDASSTHIHQASKGKYGPNVLDLNNPNVDVSDLYKEIFDCITPSDNSVLKSIESTPAEYSVDIHTSLFVEGAVRGSLSASTNQPQCNTNDKQCNVLDPGRLEKPWSQTNTAFLQCYNPATHVCIQSPNSPAYFLCPVTANKACGRACYNEDNYSCTIQTDWIDSYLQVK